MEDTETQHQPSSQPIKTIGNTIHFANFATVYLMSKKCKKCTQPIRNENQLKQTELSALPSQNLLKS